MSTLKQPVEFELASEAPAEDVANVRCVRPPGVYRQLAGEGRVRGATGPAGQEPLGLASAWW